MPTITLGRTQLTVEKNGFGALPIQRVSMNAATALLQKAYDHGMTLFDTARAYTDSEEKMAHALASVRKNIVIATKTGAQTADVFWEHLEKSLATLRTDYIDIYQFHNPAFCPKPGEENGLYDAMVEAKRQGKIRFIGLTNHRLLVAHEAVASGLYDTLQFPLSYLSADKDRDLVDACAKANMGFLGMKALSGGLITHPKAASAFLAALPNVAPLWGVQREEELDDFLAFIQNPPEMTPQLMAQIDEDRRALSGNFCRGCGYCMPCPAYIEINNCARMSLLIRRSPSAPWQTEEWQEKMKLIENCLQCGQCKSKCPYELDTPALLKENLLDYQQLLEKRKPIDL